MPLRSVRVWSGPMAACESNWPFHKIRLLSSPCSSSSSPPLTLAPPFILQLLLYITEGMEVLVNMLLEVVERPNPASCTWNMAFKNRALGQSYFVCLFSVHGDHTSRPYLSTDSSTPPLPTCIEPTSSFPSLPWNMFWILFQRIRTQVKEITIYFIQM